MCVLGVGAAFLRGAIKLWRACLQGVCKKMNLSV